MKFKFGARARSGQYTVRPQHQIVDPISKRVETTRGIRIHFKEHTWDSVQAQKEYQWSDEEREEAEQYLLNHPDFGKVDGRGIFVDQTAKQLSAAEINALYANRDMNELKKAMAGEPNNGVVEMARQLMEQAQALLKSAGVDLSSVPDVQPGETTDVPPQQVCIQMIVAGDDSIQCGNPVADGEDFCEVCLREIQEEQAKKQIAAKSAKKAPKKKSEKELAAAGSS